MDIQFKIRVIGSCQQGRGSSACIPFQVGHKSTTRSFSQGTQKKSEFFSRNSHFISIQTFQIVRAGLSANTKMNNVLEHSWCHFMAQCRDSIQGNRDIISKFHETNTSTGELTRVRTQTIQWILNVSNATSAVCFFVSLRSICTSLDLMDQSLSHPHPSSNLNIHMCSCTGLFCCTCHHRNP